jgi:hypothetical protein
MRKKIIKLWDRKLLITLKEVAVRNNRTAERVFIKEVKRRWVTKEKSKTHWIEWGLHI